ncbi:GntR family transcriptional regulator [Neobacillus niacini]|jgi:GntR family transcriptional regulator|uniref:GntR family transcriptional regulator n=1 Tax=Neobacillus niacini TaxID=86668 RepID=UPI001C8E000C|nr:GntR family transcriptional regulator [Neobacillus niacini]MBY0149151.1 GntR family transcriptional regulator [Neobacillus niacini]
MKIPIHVSEESREPIYHQVETQIKTLIASGQLLPGTPLPSIRALAGDVGCSVITTRRVYQNLENAGFIKTVQGKGTFVREIENVRKEETRQKVVYEAFEKAVEQGMQLGCTEEELGTIFQESIKKYYKNGG